MSDATTLTIVTTAEGVAVHGEIDAATAHLFNDALQKSLRSSQVREKVLVDLAAVAFMDSSGLRVLVDAQTQAHDAGSTIVLQRAPAAIRRLLEISGLTEHLPVEG